jgi:ABC-type antimicrobial peptide transport system permease subunit
MSLVLRATGDMTALNRLVRGEVAALDAGLAPPATRPLSELVELSLLPQRLAARFAGALGTLALVLALSGVYGIVAYAVGSRRRELGVRSALGGEPAGLVLLTMRGGLLLVALGILVGLLGLALLTPLLRQFLLDVSAFDPIALTLAGGALLGAATVACWLPARRAARVDPVIALRAQ